MRKSINLEFTKEHVADIMVLARDCKKGSLSWDKRTKRGALVIRMDEDTIYRFTICETMKTFIDLEKIQDSYLNTLYKLVK